MSGTWRLERRSGTSQELHDLDLVPNGDAPAERLVRWNQVGDASLVVGSAQPAGSVDPDALAVNGLRAARRRSGGGAVLLVPGAQVWVDVFLPAGDVLWSDDVDRSAWWLGDVWAATLAALRPEVRGRLAVHRSGSTAPTAGRIACFASIGPGEVVLDGDKLVGISQRRTRRWARFQCVVPIHHDPDLVLSSLSESSRTAEVERGLHRVASWGPADEWSVVEGLVAHLPD